MLHHRYFVVVTKNEDVRTLQAALYDHSRIAAQEVNVPYGDWKGRTVSIVETAADSADRVDFLSSYQKGRLGSFYNILADGETYNTYQAAEAQADEKFGAIVDYVPAMTPGRLRYEAAERLAAEFGDDVSEWTV